MRKTNHKRSPSVDHRKVSSSDESSFSLNSFVITPPDSPNSIHTPSFNKRIIDLDEVTKKSSEYQRKLSDFSLERLSDRPSVTKISEFPHRSGRLSIRRSLSDSSAIDPCSYQEGGDEPIISLGDILKEDIRYHSTELKRIPSLPDSSNQLLRKYSTVRER
ncbi:hypothetical protein CLIB1444_10S04896 [[Candida] jaroonii]|uniref:Uncharacterized protein n=1 Tax=[Candida] jaroonii TaxID=467808 RepID=A0ACA9YCD4_9ASCO|nr:hypothetical protein CLIB1444_10S04896 [[Candida] jaroonii]